MCHGHCVTCPLTLSQSQHLTSSAQKQSPIRLQNLEGQPYGCEKIRAFGSCTLLLPLDIAAPTLLLGKMVHTFIAAKVIIHPRLWNEQNYGTQVARIARNVGPAERDSCDILNST